MVRPGRRARGAAVAAALVALVIGTAAVGNAAGDAEEAHEDDGHGHGGGAALAVAQVHGPDGARLGSVALRQKGDAVVVRARFHGLAPGFHGFHVHQTGDCTAPDFTSAGGHYNPAGAGHGQHAADFPSVLAQDDGSARLIFATDRFTVAELFDADGSAVIVHVGPDNYANIPSRYVSTTAGAPGPDDATLATGDSGGRAGCGVVGG